MTQITPLGAKLNNTNDQTVRPATNKKLNKLSTHEIKIFSQTGTMDVAKYTTKKTIAQGLLDISLLTANISQLKNVLQVGHKHEFHTLLMTLLSISIFLQVSLLYGSAESWRKLSKNND